MNYNILKIMMVGLYNISWIKKIQLLIIVFLLKIFSIKYFKYFVIKFKKTLLGFFYSF